MPPSAMVGEGISPTTGGSSTGVTVKVTGSESVSPGVDSSVAVKVIVSTPNQFSSGALIVAIRLVMSTKRSEFPLKDHMISLSSDSTSLTKSSRLMVAKSVPSATSWSGMSTTSGGSSTLETITRMRVGVETAPSLSAMVYQTSSSP